MSHSQFNYRDELAPTPGERCCKMVARVLLPLLSLTTMLQPAAYGAPTPSLLSQEPMFLNSRVDSNVMFLMDDSLSMDDIRLPSPVGLDAGESTGGNVTVNAEMPNPATGAFSTVAVSVERVNEWIYRTSILNPVYYNPAITYTPWNDNGRAGSVAPFLPANTGKIGPDAIGFREGLVAHDMRYVGPNYESSRGANRNRKLTTTGANPPGVPAYVAVSRPPQGGFLGATDANRNQDIFSSPLVYVTQAPACSVPLVPAIASPQPSAPRTTTTQPNVPDTSTARPSSPQTYTARTSTAPTTTPRTYVAETYTVRTTTAQPFTARTVTTRSSTARTSTAVPSSGQSYTQRTVTAQTSTPRPMQYRYEVSPTCTTWSAWTTSATAPASPGLCPDPTTETGSRPAVVQSQAAPCAAGTTASVDGLSCVTNCPANSTSNGTSCISNCGAGTTAGVVGGQQVCLANCAAGYTANGSATSPMCVGTCAAGSTLTAGQCLQDCTGTTTAGTVGSQQVCFAACASGSAVNGSNAGQCITNCAAGTTAGTSGGQPVCFSACPAGTTLSGGQCLSNCPANTSTGTVGGQPVCLAACTGGTTPGTVNGNPVCLSPCPNGTTTGTANGLPICVGACPAGSTLINGACYANCAAGKTAATVNNVPVCLNACAAGTTANGSNSNPQCLGACPAGSTLSSGACLANCAAGTTAGTVGSQAVCFSPCPANTTATGTNQCITTCPAGTTTSGNNCLSACPTGSTLTGSQCYSCPAGSSSAGNNQCCPATGGGSNCPAGLTCSALNQYYPDPNQPALAHYYKFVPVSTTRAPTPTELVTPGNYVRIQINRDFPQIYSKPYKNNDPTQGVADRLDCGVGATCTQAQEMQNFANWFTYYRTRLFSAMAVTAESLSGLSHARGLDSLRLGYGSINYFPGGYDPYSPGYDPSTRVPPSGTLQLPTYVDPAPAPAAGQPSPTPPSVGAIVRGVRPFTEVSPPPAPGSNDRRQEMFDWLFSLRAISQTPNREALDAAGRYFARDDSTGPWIQPDSPTTWSSSEITTQHLSCRRNFAILVTDGEWTRGLYTTVQPLMEDSSRPMLPSSLSQQPGTPLDALTTNGPVLTAAGAAASSGTWQYTPGSQPQFSTNAGSTPGTLTDVALYYWSRDLRPDLPNSIVPKPGTPDIAFWQHMTPYIVGYGISASLNTSSTRSAIANSSAVTWPTVVMENRATEQGTIITDHDVFPVYPPDPGPDRCRFSATANPAGCGREDDTFRAAMAGRGDFLTATDIPALAQSVALAFNAANAVDGSGTSIGGRSAALKSGDLLYIAGFRTIEWTGDLSAYDALTWFSAAAAGQTAPAPVWRANFPSNRNILTWSETGGSGAGGATTFQYANVSPTQKTALGGDINGPPTVDYLRGGQSRELQNGGQYRTRSTVLGDIVDSSPLYSKAPDNFYAPGRVPAAAPSVAGNAYLNYVRNHSDLTTGRRAAIYVGANDGMLHAFTADTGAELFGYVPRSVYGQLSLLTSPYYIHRYFVDGAVTEGDIYFNNAWHTVVVGTSGAGPTGAFALDVTDPTNVGTGNVLWDKTGADNADLGHVLGQGVIGSARDGQWYYFTGNGYESQNDKATLIAINMTTGAITSIATDGAGGPNPAPTTPRSGKPNGLGAVTPVYDDALNIVALYAGDQLGRMWKFDLSASTLGNLSASTTLMFDTATNSVTGAGAQPITAAPQVTQHPLGGRYIVFGTGSFFETADRSDATVQSVYALWEQNVSSPVTISRSRLRQMTLTQTFDLASGHTFRGLDGLSALNFVGTTPDLGWYFNLALGGNATGERVITTPIESLGFVNVTSYEPLTVVNPCAGGGQSFYYKLDVADTFGRGAFSGRPISDVGVDSPPTVAQPVMMTLAPPISTVAPINTLTLGDIAAAQSDRNRYASGNPCPSDTGTSIGNAPFQAPGGPCQAPALRTWRDLPRFRR